MFDGPSFGLFGIFTILAVVLLVLLVIAPLKLYSIDKTLKEILETLKNKQ